MRPDPIRVGPLAFRAFPPGAVLTAHRFPMFVLFRMLFGYAISALGAYFMVIDVKPFTPVPFFVGLAVLVIGAGIAHPAQAIPMLGYAVSAVGKLAFWRRGSDDEHEHRRRADPGEPHHHKRHTPTRKRLSIGAFTISAPMIPEDDTRPKSHHDHPHHKRRSDDDGE